jgi:hypothetical protein
VSAIKVDEICNIAKEAFAMLHVYSIDYCLPTLGHLIYSVLHSVALSSEVKTLLQETLKYVLGIRTRVSSKRGRETNLW